MKHKIAARIGTFFLAAAAAASAAAMPASAVTGTSSITQGDAFMPAAQTYWTYSEQYKFPAGKYWNGGDPDSCTWTPCTDHHNDNSFQKQNVFSAGYTQCLQRFGGGVQCYGFAAKLAYDYFGGANAWIRYTTPYSFQFRFGDQVRVINNNTGALHSIFVTAVNGNTIKFADCNAAGDCKIRWNVTATVSNSRIYFDSADYTIYYVERPIMEGDVNGDCQITWDDISILYQIVAGTYNFSGKQQNVIMEAADINNDGTVTVADWVTAYTQYNGSGYFSCQGFLTNVYY